MTGGNRTRDLPTSTGLRIDVRGPLRRWPNGVVAPDPPTPESVQFVRREGGSLGLAWIALAIVALLVSGAAT